MWHEHVHDVARARRLRRHLRVAEHQKIGASLLRESPPEREERQRDAHFGLRGGGCKRAQLQSPARVAAARARGVRLVRSEGRGVSDQYGVRGAACPLSPRGEKGGAGRRAWWSALNRISTPVMASPACSAPPSAARPPTARARVRGTRPAPKNNPRRKKTERQLPHGSCKRRPQGWPRAPGPAARGSSPPPSSRTNSYKVDTPRPSPRTNWTRRCAAFVGATGIQ
jgi:hypothetical protein